MSVVKQEDKIIHFVRVAMEISPDYFNNNEVAEVARHALADRDIDVSRECLVKRINNLKESK